MYLVDVLVYRGIAERVQLLLRLPHKGIQPRLHIRQLIPNMIQQHRIQLFLKVLRPVLMRDIPIRRMAPKEFLFGRESVGHVLLGVDVLLRAVHDADEAELERVDASGEDVERVRARVHEVELREHADRASALWVDGTRELEGFRIREIDVRGGDGEDHAGRGSGMNKVD